MSKTSRASNPRYHVHTLHEYGLAPLSTAMSRIEHEREEIANERDAFREFRVRVADIETVLPSSTPRCFAESTDRRPQSDAFERVRVAYQATVMDVPHYEDVYDEPLLEHFASEFGAEVANGVRPESSVSFTAPYKHALVAKTTRAIRRREDFLEMLDEEARSIESAQTALADVFAALDTTIIPEWHCESFTERLDAVAQRRQRTIQERDSVARLDEHSLCMYLYEEEPWTYPVLIAVARTREAVTLERSATPGTTNSARG